MKKLVIGTVAALGLAGGAVVAVPNASAGPGCGPNDYPYRRDKPAPGESYVA